MTDKTRAVKIVTVQPADKTDQILPDGTELTQRPYPFHVDEDGSIGRQDFWAGKPLRVLGFAEKLDRHQIDLPWAEAFAEPKRCLGMYVVTQNEDGGIATHLTAVASVEVSGDE